MQLPNGLISFGSKANCTLELCPVESSILTYQPSIPQNVAIIALFFVSMLIHIAQGIRWRSWDFMIMVCIGIIDEIIGYGGRLLYNHNPFSFNAFLIQIVCITTAPVFFCSAIYVMLSRTINHLDRSIYRFNPKILVWTFIPSDLVSLVLQALGGALSATQASSGGQTGVTISKAGLVIQVITLTIFLLLFLDYVILYHRKSNAGPLSMRLKVFLSFLFLSIIFIFIRCGFRVKELEQGYKGEMMHDEKGFMILEAGMMVIAVYCLNVAHPGIAFGREIRSKKIAASGYTTSDDASIQREGGHEVKLALLNQQMTGYPQQNPDQHYVPEQQQYQQQIGNNGFTYHAVQPQPMQQAQTQGYHNNKPGNYEPVRHN